MLLILAADSEAGRAGGTIGGGGESESSLHRCLNATFVCAIDQGMRACKLPHTVYIV